MPFWLLSTPNSSRNPFIGRKCPDSTGFSKGKQGFSSTISRRTQFEFIRFGIRHPSFGKIPIDSFADFCQGYFYGSFKIWYFSNGLCNGLPKTKFFFCFLTFSNFGFEGFIHLSKFGCSLFDSVFKFFVGLF